MRKRNDGSPESDERESSHHRFNEIESPTILSNPKGRSGALMVKMNQCHKRVVPLKQVRVVLVQHALFGAAPNDVRALKVGPNCALYILRYRLTLYTCPVLSCHESGSAWFMVC